MDNLNQTIDLIEETPELTATNCVYAYLAQNPELQGSKALALLMLQPEQPVFCKELTLALNPIDTPYTASQIEHLTRLQEIIPMTDKVALKQVRQELMKLYRIKAELITEGKTSPRLDADIAGCEKYIKDTTTPYGIKSFITDEKAAYDSISAAIRRLIKKAETECHEAAWEIKKHLKTGRYSVWHL